MLKDKLGRVIDNLRISVTDRCNLRCLYCMPEEGLDWFPKEQILTFEEIERLVRIFAELGVNKIRLTGGEPLVRKNLHLLIKKLNAIPQIQDIGMTTNGLLFKKYAQQLFDAGLSRVNISLDSLDPKIFFEMTRRDQLNDVIEAIKEAQRIGFSPIKINLVPIKGMNDHEMLEFGHFARDENLDVRFIEFMPIGADDWTLDDVVPTQKIKDVLNQISPLVEVPHDERLPAAEYTFADGKGKVGFISSVTEPFCGSCNRVRITADGRFRTCLFSIEETNFLALLREGKTDDEIAKIIEERVWIKEPGHLINKDAFVKPTRTMSQIGG
ncbi:MAG: GTP 3',8-cyclase MoaA [Calditrichaeota bacterium]|nr:MAG: GTP 3',8-cyclase MoaA [Calditrichota bacterium]